MFTPSGLCALHRFDQSQEEPRYALFGPVVMMFPKNVPSRVDVNRGTATVKAVIGPTIFSQIDRPPVNRGTLLLLSGQRV